VKFGRHNHIVSEVSFANITTEEEDEQQNRYVLPTRGTWSAKHKFELEKC